MKQNSNLDSSKSPLIKLLKDPLSLTSIIIIGIFFFLSIGAYFVSPDSTPYANEQHLEIAVKSPGFKIFFLEEKKINQREKKIFQRENNFFQRLFYGSHSEYISTPIYRHWKQEGKQFIETYTGDSPNNGEIISIDENSDYRISERTYILGTDRYGRCLLSQLIVGTRVSIAVGFISLIISLFIGITLGAVAGYFGGWIDNVIMWLINVVWSIPTVLLVVAITFALGKGFWQVFIAIGLTMWVDIARMVRGQVKSIKEKEFVTASRALGFSNRRIIIKHILPNIIGPITVISASNFASAILQEAGLSFLGLGVQPPMPSWGSIIKENYGYIILDAAYMAIAPGIAIMLLVLSFFTLGSGIRKVIDVRN